MTWLNAPSGTKDRLPVRTAEYNVVRLCGDGQEEPPRPPGPQIVEPRATPPRHAGRNHARTRTRYPETDSKADTEHEHRKTPGNHKHLKSVVLVPYAPSKIEKSRYRYRFVANRSSSAADCLRVSIK
jgi:hypothetical protein